MNETATRQLMANTCPQTKEQKMQRQKARSEIANAKPKGKRQVKASQGNTSWCCTIKVDIENSKGQYIEKDKQEATKDGSESTKIQHGI